MRNAIFYLTYNGIYNFTNGIGTQTQLFLSGLECKKNDLERQFGAIDVHLVCPSPDQSTWGYDATFLRQQRRRIATLGGQLHLLEFKTRQGQELWDIHAWQRLCTKAAALLLRHTASYDRSLIICVDQPWLHTPRYMTTLYNSMPKHVQILLVLYNTAFIRNWRAPDRAELAWEQHGLAFSRPGNRVYLADICPSFTRHLTSHFSLSAARFAPYTSSILVEDKTYAPQTLSHIQETLHAHNIPLDEDIVFAFGRAAPIKGFETLIPALAAVRERCHFVLISVPYLNDGSQQQLYDNLLDKHRIHATHVRHFTRALPRALCQWPRTKMVVLPSEQETFSNVPLEVALWARQSGPVVVAAHVGGFVDQIAKGKTGFFINTASCSAMMQTLQDVLSLPPEAHAAIRHNAHQHVIRHYSFNANFPTTLHWLWGSTNPGTSTAGVDSGPGSLLA